MIILWLFRNVIRNRHRALQSLIVGCFLFVSCCCCFWKSPTKTQWIRAMIQKMISFNELCVCACVICAYFIWNENTIYCVVLDETNNNNTLLFGVYDANLKFNTCSIHMIPFDDRYMPKRKKKNNEIVLHFRIEGSLKFFKSFS